VEAGMSHKEVVIHGFFFEARAAVKDKVDLDSTLSSLVLPSSFTPSVRKFVAKNLFVTSIIRISWAAPSSWYNPTYVRGIAHFSDNIPFFIEEEKVARLQKLIGVVNYEIL
jgi:hypothetical protein